MSETKPVKVKEMEALQRYHSDGALDIIIGALLLNLGLDVLNQSPSASLLTWVPIIVFTSMKNRYTIPRITLKNIGVDEAKVKYWSTQTAVGLGIGLLLTSMFILGDPMDIQSKLVLPWEGDIHNLSFGLICAAELLIAGWLTKLRRFYYYALAAFAISLVCYFLLPVYVPIFITAIIILVVGIKIMTAFSRQYPDPQKKEIKQ